MERLLAAFKETTLSFVILPGQMIVHITPFTPFQSRIPELLNFSILIYADLEVDIRPNPVSHHFIIERQIKISKNGKMPSEDGHEMTVLLT